MDIVSWKLRKSYRMRKFYIQNFRFCFSMVMFFCYLFIFSKYPQLLSLIYINIPSLFSMFLLRIASISICSKLLILQNPGIANTSIEQTKFHISLFYSNESLMNPSYLTNLW